MVDGDDADASVASTSESSRADRIQRVRRRRRIDRAVGLLVLVISTAVCIGLIAVGQVKANADSVAVQRENRDYTPPAVQTPTPAAAVDQIAVVGDEWAAPRNTQQNRPWTILLQQQTGVRVRAFASDGGAYLPAAVGRTGAPFSSATSGIPPNSSLIVFFGGARDASDDSVDLAAAATQTVADAMKRAPRAQVVIVGPVPTRPGRDDALQSVRTILKTVASTARVSWIDPVEERWMNSSRYWSPTAAAPSTAGNVRLAQRMQSALRPFLTTSTAAAGG